MTLWQTVWRDVRAEMPEMPSRQRSWGGFFGALVAALLIIAIWFPIRLIAELLKAINLSEKPDHRAEAQALLREAHVRSCDLPSPNEFADSVMRYVDLPTSLQERLFEALRRLYAENLLLEVPSIPEDLDGLEGIRWRDRLRREIPRMNEATLIRMRRACLAGIEAAIAGLPKIAGDGEVTSPLATLTTPGRFIERLVAPLDADLFPHFSECFEENARRISGIPRTGSVKPAKLAEPHHLDDPSPFLAGTPFDSLLSTPLGVEIPRAARSSHHWIVAGTGAGKTNALEYLIAKDLERAARGECSLVVLDSQHQLIDKLWSLKLFAPGGALDGKLCLLDAADIEFPLAINLFDMRLDRMGALSALDRERITNSALEMYDFIIGSLLQAEMTSRQSTLFRFVTRAMFAIPGATIHTLRDLLQNGSGKYQHAIDTLDDVTREFFATDFNSTQFKQTKEQVVSRLWTVLGNQTFSRMFSSPQSKINLFEEVNTPGKVILINAEKGLLKEEGTELFGRFFLALINQAAAQRSNLPVDARLPCYVYVDECHNYIRNDPKIQVILAESRQQNIGVILAHQFLGQIETPVLRALTANTAIKMAARLEGGDRPAMARDMNTVPDFIRDQKVGAFAVFIRDYMEAAISMYFPLRTLSRFERMTEGERRLVKQRNRERYATAAASPASESGPQPAAGASGRQRRDPDA